jgi:hypothetical protein
MLFLHSFAFNFFNLQYASTADFENMTECFLYPLFSALEDSFEDFVKLLARLSLVPLSQADLSRTIQYIKDIGFEQKIQNLFKFMLCTRFLTHKYFNSQSHNWEKNQYYDASCIKSFLILNKNPGIF